MQNKLNEVPYFWIEPAELIKSKSCRNNKHICWMDWNYYHSKFKIPSGCFIPGVIDLKKSSGVIYISLSPCECTTCKVAKYRNILSLKISTEFFFITTNFYAIQSCIYSRSRVMTDAVFVFNYLPLSESNLFLFNNLLWFIVNSTVNNFSWWRVILIIFLIT